MRRKNPCEIYPPDRLGVARRAYRFGLETLNKDPTIPQEAIISMVRLMADLALIDRSTASNTPPAAFYDNSLADEMKRTGFLADLWK